MRFVRSGSHVKKTGAVRQAFQRIIVAVVLAIILGLANTAAAKNQWPGMVFSADGTPISYEMHGQKGPALVFVHGWSCDSRYWRCQVQPFSEKYRIVLIDLAGHGHSGSGRTVYSMKAFGQDVKAVVEEARLNDVVLIGHSMGGAVIAQAAALMPGRVKGLIGVDTLQNVEYPMTRQALDQMTAPLKKEFKTAARHFVQQMILPGTDEKMIEWILSDMAAATPGIALSAMEEMMTLYITGGAAGIFDQVRLPVIGVNADLWPVNYEANRRHMLYFDTIMLKGTDHFLMMTAPKAFNNALEKAVKRILAYTETE